MKQYRAIGFDLDGTLFDHRGSAIAGLNVFLRGRGIAASREHHATWFRIEDEQYERWRAGLVSHQEQRRERLRQLLPLWGQPTPGHTAGLDEVFAEYLAAYRAGWQAYPDSAQVLAGLRSAGYRVGILTNGAEEQQQDKIREIGLADLVQVVCTSERIGAQKPDPQAFLTLAGDLGAEADECLFVGDNPAHDIAGAKAVGMGTLLVDRGGEHGSGISGAIAAVLGLPAARLEPPGTEQSELSG